MTVTLTMNVAATTDWVGVARDLGPGFAARAAAHDADNSFVADNYDELKAGRLALLAWMIDNQDHSSFEILAASWSFWFRKSDGDFEQITPTVCTDYYEYIFTDFTPALLASLKRVTGNKNNLLPKDALLKCMQLAPSP